MFGTKMATEGLPLGRWERGADQDILAGADFLSVFMESSLRRAYRETTTTPSITTFPTTLNSDFEVGSTDSYVRTSRGTSFNIAQSSTEEQSSLYETTLSAQIQDNSDNSKEESSDKVNEGVIVAVHVSSSIGRTLINKKIDNSLDQTTVEDTTLSESATEPTTTLFPDQNFVASEEHPSIIAEANKSEFSVEESEPITRNSDLDASEFSRSYPASVHELPRRQNLPFNPSSGYLTHDIVDDDSKQPLHQTVIYHNNPRQTGRARSVSYSTVIQAVPNGHTEKNWATDKPPHHERHERHYDDSQQPFRNIFDNNEQKRKQNDTTKSFPPQSSVAETNNYFVTSMPSANQNTPTNWEKPEKNYEERSTSKSSATTERNWEVQEKSYPPSSTNTHVPKVYGRPEQNYEVDEAVSVVTNGRAHGVQPSQPPVLTKQELKDADKKIDDNQKVGYVVEGRNYKKYRVEERTADGFIVGEYGVVSNDDGSLRGVRYTADGTISPRLIYDALMKFLAL